MAYDSVGTEDGLSIHSLRVRIPYRSPNEDNPLAAVEQRECKHHGLTNFRQQSYNGKTSYYCITCHVERQRARRLAKKHRAIAHKGGCCSVCGYDKCEAALDFHHTDPSEKDADFTQMKNWSWERIRGEIDKCILVCANCHREIHHALEALR